MSASEGLGRRFPELLALRVVFSRRRYLGAYLVAAPVVALGYGLLLPSLLLGAFGLWVLRFLTLLQATFAIAMGALLPMALLVNLFVWRNPQCCSLGRTGEGRTAGALLLSVIPNALCCTPVIPALLALFVSGGTLVAASASTQYWLGTYAGVLYGISALALWGSLRVAARRVPSTAEAERGQGTGSDPSAGVLGSS